ncbi:hypothetical protein FRB95_008659 [Tulasnella sp. JGI-2019a]|nr:hypothetical protein FRB95_008659 [Tulasnella sp. JGI-2019a]
MPLVLLGIIVVLGVLIPLNFALTGYETVSTFQSDFNTVPDLWFWHFGNKPPSGSLCDPRTLSMGDTLVTNYGLLTWTVDIIFGEPLLGVPSNSSAPLNLPTVEYSGNNPDNCDVLSLTVVENMQPQTGTFKAIVVCNDTNFPVILGTAYTVDFLGNDKQTVLS